MSRVTHKSQLSKSGYPHREHRSKKGRTYKPDYWRVVNFKRKVNEIRENEIMKTL